MPVVDPIRNAATPSEAAGARSQDAERGEQPARAPSPYWGDEAIWTSAGERAQLRDGRTGARMGCRAHPSERRPRPSVSKGSSHPSAMAFPLSAERPADADVRSEDEAGDDHRHVLRHASPELRRQRRAVVHGRRSGRRLVRHEDVRQDQGRAEGAGMDRVRPRHQRQRQARRVRRAGSADRSDEGQADQRSRSTASRRARSTARSGDPCWACRARSFVWCPGRIRPRPRCRKSTKCRGTIRRRARKASLRAAWTSTANGVVWTVLSSGHLASFDRRKCKGPLNGPTATGQHCPEGWSLYPLPGPNYKGATDSASADSAYYNFVDRFDMLGVGKNVPLATGNLIGSVCSRSLTASS